jgi:hypothetical protein
MRPALQVPGRWDGRPGTAALAIELPASAALEGIAARNLLTGDPLGAEDVRLEERGSIPAPPAPPGRPVFAPAVAGITVEGTRVRIGPGQVVLREMLEVPEGYETRLEPGLDLRMGPGASLILHGDLSSAGTAARPVRVRALDPAATWGTLAVLGTRTSPRRVLLEHTVLEGGTGGETERVAVSGAFSVHDGIVTVRASQFLDARGEDGINLKHATIDLRDCLVQGSAIDAVDLDFCEGTVSACTLRDAGGDGIDLSGSRVTLEGNRVARTGDKGFSIGERSVVRILGGSLVAGVTGVAVKDASTVEIIDAEIAGQQVGVGAYVKKPSYGGATATLTRVRIEDVESRFLEAPGCAITVDGEPVR